MLSLGNQWFLHIPQVWAWISLGLQLRLISLHRLLDSQKVSTVYAKRGLLEASPDAMPGTAITVVGDPLCSGMG